MKATLTLFLFVLIGTGSAIFSQTVTIGTQVWMIKNLDVATFRNGDPIPQAKTAEEWVKAGENQQPAWCYYDNDPANGAKYGKLYNWYAVNDSRGLAPVGYHIPSDAEWRKLTDFLGGEDIAGAKMKSKPIYKTEIKYVEEGGYDETKWVPCNNCSYWTEKQKANNPCSICRNQGGKTIKTGKYIPKTKRKVEDKIQIGGWNGTNESGFSGLPGADCGYNGTFYDIGEKCYWWSSSESSNFNAWGRYLGYLYGDVNTVIKEKADGCSVRCLRD